MRMRGNLAAVDDEEFRRSDGEFNFCAIPSLHLLHLEFRRSRSLLGLITSIEGQVLRYKGGRGVRPQVMTPLNSSTTCPHTHTTDRSTATSRLTLLG
jgi:hypothetical protein